MRTKYNFSKLKGHRNPYAQALRGQKPVRAETHEEVLKPFLKNARFRDGYRRQLERLRSSSVLVTVKKVQRTCRWCPSQWEGTTVNGRPIYARYRHGHLSVRVGKRGGSIGQAVKSGKEVVDAIIGNDLDGFLAYAELKRYTKRLILWPARAEDRDASD